LAVRLRLRRVGRKKFPIYKVVATDKRSPRDGRFIESVGQYEPLRNDNVVTFNEERVMYWLKNGAQPSATVQNLLRSQGLWLKWSLIKKGADESTITDQLEKFSMQRAEREQQAKEKAADKKKEKAAPEKEQPAAAESAPEEAPTSEEKQETTDVPEEQKTAPAEGEEQSGEPEEKQSAPEETETDSETQQDTAQDDQKEEPSSEDSSKKE